ncbi:MAG: ABC transporter permease [Puia sp.]|nr:ABC transporter permease [Puia sp.]
MLKNYLRTAIRAIFRNRIYSLVNILGLTLGLCACMIVATVVIDDLSYDKQWSRGKDLYRIITVNKLGEQVFNRFGNALRGLGPELKKNFPEVEATAGMIPDEISLRFKGAGPNGVSLSMLRADTSFWGMLDIPILAGNPRRFVDGPGNLVISESLRDRFFKGHTPVGETFYDVPNGDDAPQPYVITGVMKDLPLNSHLHGDMILVRKPHVEPLNHDYSGSYGTQYLMMRPGTDMKAFEAKVNAWYSAYTKKDGRYQYEYQPIKDVYLHSDFESGMERRGNIRNIYIFSGVAVLLLLIACINFVNLSTARTISRLKETGVRKIIGAGKKDILLQFLSESVVYFGVSAVLAVILYQAFLPVVVRFLGHVLVQTFVSRLSLIVAGICSLFVISLSTGIYPAWILSGFKPVLALRGRLSGIRPGQNSLQRALVVVQFSISIVVLLAMIVVQQQVRFMEKADIGYDKKSLLSIGFNDWGKKGQDVKNELLQIPGVKLCSISSFVPPRAAGTFSTQIEDPSHPGTKITEWIMIGDVDLAATLGLHLVSGRVFDPSLASDVPPVDTTDGYKFSNQTALVTESTAKIMGIRSLNEKKKDLLATPVGIVKDFHNESLRDPLAPTLIMAERAPEYGGMLIRVEPGRENEVRAPITKVLERFFPGRTLEVRRVGELLDNQYKAERKLEELFAFFSALTMVLASLGIFGLIVYSASLRVKEIGLRKVLGASIASVVGLLSMDFIKLVAIAMLVASPIGGWLMHRWLQDFAFRISLGWELFAIAGGVTLLIAFVTVGLQALKAAKASPVGSLRAD